jgi:mono/diheme cytochrome c family protein
MVKTAGKWLVILLALIGLAVIVAGVGFLNTGISAKPEPSAIEAAVATRLRSLAIPTLAKKRPNPVRASPEVVAEGMSHWADHCASCHGNTGDGQTEIGRGLYPRAPDMRLPTTQRLSDGTLFYIIEEGVKLTGMPAWGTGTPEGEEASWQLVHFIRHLPKLTPEDIEKMEGMNPKSPTAMTEEEEMRKFLEGETTGPKPGAKPMKHRGHK